ncbi:hypothetical protein A4A49_55618, partial [Nicotiana attenuata]
MRKRQTIQEQKTGNTIQATVNPSSSKTKVDCRLSSTIGNLVTSIGEGSGSLKGAINQSGSVAASLPLEKGNGTVTSHKTGEIVAFVDGVPVYVEEKGGDEGVPKDGRKDTVSSDHQRDQGKGSDFNGTVTQTVFDHCATVNPNLGSVYELQYKMMHGKMIEVSSNPQQVEAAITPYEQTKHALVTNEIAALPMVSSSGTGSPLQIKVNIPLKSPNQMLHDIITHQELPIEIQTAVDQQNQLEEEGDDESTAENFKDVMREGDVSPTAVTKSGRKGRKN